MDNNHDPKGRNFTEVIRAIIEQDPSPTDPFGSYTGRPAQENETPVQDADDL